MPRKNQDEKYEYEAGTQTETLVQRNLEAYCSPSVKKLSRSKKNYLTSYLKSVY